MTYAELTSALRIFGFSGSDLLTMTQIKRRHRELVKSAHPDRAGVANVSPEPMQRINAAASVLQAYLHSYQFSFSEEEFYRQNPEERLRVQFGSDPWGSA